MEVVFGKEYQMQIILVTLSYMYVIYELWLRKAKILIALYCKESTEGMKVVYIF